MAYIIHRILAGEPLNDSEINKLLVQQSPDTDHRIIERAELEETLRNPNFCLLVAIEKDSAGVEHYVGMATMFFQRNIARWIAEIHDVVVDESLRGHGIGETLVKSLVEIAQEFCKIRRIQLKLFLTSRTSRVAANKLYQKLGFVLVAQSHGPWGTNLYKIIVEPWGLRGL